MNLEVSALKKRNERLENSSKYLDMEERKALAYKLNTQMGYLYTSGYENKIDSETVIFNVATCMCDVMEAFAMMDISPDYLWRTIMQMQVVSKMVTEGKSKSELSLRERDIIESHAKYLYDKIRQVIKSRDEGKLTDDSESMNVNDNYVELASFYSVFKLPFKNNELLKSRNYLQKVGTKCMRLNDDLLNTDDAIDDVYCLMKMIFEYMCFFVEIGVNPKKYVDEVMEEKIKNNQHIK